jgi:hypothetical protein
MLYDGTFNEHGKQQLLSNLSQVTFETVNGLHKYKDEIKRSTSIQMPIHIFLAPLLYFALFFYVQLL